MRSLADLFVGDFLDGRVREGEEHLAATAKLFDSESVDSKPLREIWRTARAQADETFIVHPAPFAETASSETAAPQTHRRASIAIMPFDDTSPMAIPGGSSDALVHDITRLARQRSLSVIAQGTMFALRDRRYTPRLPGCSASTISSTARSSASEGRHHRA